MEQKIDYKKLSKEELLKIYSDDAKTDEIKNKAFEALQELHGEESKKGQLALFIEKKPVEQISITEATNITKKPIPITEEWIADLIKSGRISEEKAFYALSVQKVVSVLFDLKDDHQKALEAQKETQKTINEMNSKMDELIKSKDNDNNSDVDEKIETLKNKLKNKKEELKEVREENNTIQGKFEKSLQEIEDLKNNTIPPIDNQEEITKLQESVKTLTLKNEQLIGSEDLLEEIANILNVESFEININSIESLLLNYVKINTKPDITNSVKIQELESTLLEKESEINALDKSVSNQKETITELTQQRDKLRDIASGKEPVSDFDNAPTPDTDEPSSQEEYDNEEQDEDYEVKPKSKIKKLIKPLIYTTIAASIVAIVVFAPSEYKSKIENLATLFSKSSTNTEEVFNTVENTQKLEDSVELETPQEVIKQENINPAVNTQSQDIFNQKNTKVGIEREVIIPENKTPNRKQAKEVSDKDYLSNLKSYMKVTPDLKVEYNGKIYSKGQSFEKFTIAYITPNFILFMDKNKSIIKIIL